jgi:hypothetical protein
VRRAWTAEALEELVSSAEEAAGAAAGGGKRRRLSWVAATRRPLLAARSAQQLSCKWARLAKEARESGGGCDLHARVLAVLDAQGA